MLPTGCLIIASYLLHSTLGAALPAQDGPPNSNTTLTAPVRVFERSIREGVQFLRENGAGTRANIRTVVARPQVRPSRRAAEFSQLEIEVVNRDLKRDYTTVGDIDTGKWSTPKSEPENDPYLLPWLQDDYDLSLDEAIYLVEGAGFPGPWDNVIACFPVKDPLEPKAGTEAILIFHTEDQQRKYPAIGMQSRKVFMYETKPGSNGLGLSGGLAGSNGEVVGTETVS